MMRWLLATAFAVGGFAVTASGQDIAADFSRIEDTWDAALSPNGKTLAYGCQYQEKRAVCVLPIEQDGIEATVYPSSEDSRIIDFRWMSNKHVAVITDGASVQRTSKGLQTVRFNRAVSFNAATGKSAMLLKEYMNFSVTTNIRSRLTPKSDKIIMALLYTVESKGPIGTSRLRNNDELRYQPFEVDLNSGRSKQLRGYTDAVYSVLYDGEGNDLIRTVWDEEHTDFMIRDGDNRVIYRDDDRQIQPLSVLSFTEDGSDLLVWSDGESVSGYGRGVWKMSYETGEMSRIERDGFRVTGHSPVIDEHTNRAVGYRFTNSDGLSGQFLVDEELKGYQKAISDAIPDAEIKLNSWSEDRSRFIVTSEEPGRPIQYLIFEPATFDLSLLGASNEAASQRPLGQLLSITYPADDGLDIPAYLTLPEGKTREEGPFPVILMPHGGPDASDGADFDWWAQAYAAAGYAVLQPNFRGSNRYGAAFREAGFGEFGGKMITDVTDGLQWMEEQGLAKPGGACVVGASYGGYSALMAPLLRPDAIKCSVSVNGVTDPIAQMGRYRTESPEIVSYWEQYMGDLYANDAQHASITPSKRTNEYRTPVMLIHGDEDTRVRFAQFEQFRKVANGASWLTPVVMKDQDHFLGTKEARYQVLSESLAFLAKHHPVD